MTAVENAIQNIPEISARTRVSTVAQNSEKSFYEYES
jgi:hypothetical protein